MIIGPLLLMIEERACNTSILQLEGQSLGFTPSQLEQQRHHEIRQKPLALDSTGGQMTEKLAFSSLVPMTSSQTLPAD